MLDRLAGLRLMEALRLRVKNVDFKKLQVTVRSGKGDKDRRTMLPHTLARKYPNAASE